MKAKQLVLIVVCLIVATVAGAGGGAFALPLFFGAWSNVTTGNGGVAAARKTCDVTQRGKVWGLVGASSASSDVGQICLWQTNGSAYAWRAIQLP